MEVMLQMNKSLKKEVVIHKREKEQLKIVVKVKDYVTVALKNANEMLNESSNEKDKMIAKACATLKAKK
ncbi:hypothetical protein PVK06_001500 [Gossypium arboreum]|uniref:Uncharacterized protein n=1 Tax=Gossypium arboreum TaxID=29729 RepID=A0ABR0R287_GOSAR|nr:hypothetical protein PVK06_001500 [Gossypium arboreum]